MSILAITIFPYSNSNDPKTYDSNSKNVFLTASARLYYFA